MHHVLGVFAYVSPPYEYLTSVALQVVERHGLRTLDALHLAAAIIAAETTTGEGYNFATADAELAIAAAEEGMTWPEPVG